MHPFSIRPPAFAARRRARAVALIVAVGVTTALLGGCVDDFGTPPPTDFAPISVENDTPTAVRISYRIGDTNRDVGVRGQIRIAWVALSAGETASLDFDLGDRTGSPRCTIGTIIARTLEDRDVALIPPPVCAGAMLRLSEHRVASP